MVELKENTIIKKAPAKKAPALKAPASAIERDREAPPVNNMTEEINEAFASRLKDINARLESLNGLTQRTNEAVTTGNNEARVIIPNDIIVKAVEDVISAKGGELVDRMTEAEDMLAELNLTKNQEALEKLEDINNMQESLDDLQYELDDKINSNDLGDELYEYVKEYDLDDIIQDKIDTYNLEENVTLEDHERDVQHIKNFLNKQIEELATPDDIEELKTQSAVHQEKTYKTITELDELKRQVDVLTANKLRNRLKRVFKAVKRLLSPNNK